MLKGVASVVSVNVTTVLVSQLQHGKHDHTLPLMTRMFKREVEIVQKCPQILQLCSMWPTLLPLYQPLPVSLEACMQGWMEASAPTSLAFHTV
jgi:hypothetical protein